MFELETFTKNFQWFKEEHVAPIFPSASVDAKVTEVKGWDYTNLDIRAGIEVTYRIESIVSHHEIMRSRGDVGLRMAEEMYYRMHREVYGDIIKELHELRYLMFTEARPGSQAMQKVDELIKRLKP